MKLILRQDQISTERTMENINQMVDATLILLEKKQKDYEQEKILTSK